MDQVEQNILMVDWNIESLEVNTWMKTQGLANAICYLHGYSNVLITYQRSKNCPINDIYCTDPLADNRGGLLSFGILLGDHRSLCIDLHEIRLLGFQKH